MKIIFTFSLLLAFSMAYPQWTLVSNVPGGSRQGSNSFVIDGKIYLGGGEDAGGQMVNDFYEYDPGTNAWTSKTTLPDYIGGSGFFALNGEGYMVCGQNQTGNTSAVYRYDPATNSWTTMSPFPGTPMQHPASFVIGDTGYIFGGFIGGSETNQLWAYNPNTDTWTQMTSMPSVGRADAQVFVVNNIAYVGLGEYNSSANYADDVQAYNAASNSWTSVAQFPGHERAGTFGFAIGNYGYMGLGGYVMNSTGYYLSDIYSYNTVNNTWSLYDTFPGIGRANAACVQFNNDSVYYGTGASSSNFPTDWWLNVGGRSCNLVSPNITLNFDTICSNDSAQICAPAGFVSYQWNNLVDTGKCINAEQAGDYYVTVTDINGCTAVSAPKVLYVYPVPSVSITVSADTLTSYGAQAYQWFFDDSAITGATQPICVAKQSGQYSVEITDINGCTASSQPLSITGITEMPDAFDFTIYPNPVAGNNSLIVSTAALFYGNELHLYDDEGRLLGIWRINSARTVLPMAAFASGIYFLKFGEAVKKVVVQ